MGVILKVKKSRLSECLHVIHEGYEPIAVRFGLTNENCPYRGRADLPLSVLEEEFSSGIKMYGYFEQDAMVGFLSIDRASEPKINDVVVLPAFWRQGIGTALLEYAKTLSTQWGASKISLGMIDDNKELRKWYEKNGFINVGYQQYPNAPFLVGYMEWRPK